MKSSYYLGGGSHPEGVDGLFTPYSQLTFLLSKPDGIFPCSG
jgi:hypothetical protein